MDFQIIPRRTGVYMQAYNSEGFSECKLPNERYPFEFFKKLFDETPQTKLKINCLAALLIYDNVEHYPLSSDEFKYLLSICNSNLFHFILDKSASLRMACVCHMETIACNAVYYIAECNYFTLLNRLIHLVPQRTKNAALDYAATWGNLETVKVLVENGAEVKAFGGSALRFAQENGQRETVEYLLSCGV